VLFWVVKALSTALGESTSDYLVHTIAPVLAVLLGFSAFVVALALQLTRRHYMAWYYWFAVVMVGTFGTMAADVLHVALGVPYPISSALYAVVLAAVFVTWERTERTLSIHDIDTTRRELFYWAAVVATFAMGTAVGDLAAYTLHLGYLDAGLLFVGLVLVPTVGYWRGWMSSVGAFWFAYVVTRPIGASFADYMGKPRTASGLGWGDGPVAAVLAVAIVCLVAYLAVTRADVQRTSTVPRRPIARTRLAAAPVDTSRTRYPGAG